jgi:hypothetical protein
MIFYLLANMYYGHHLLLNGEDVNSFVVKDDIPQICGYIFTGLYSLRLIFECSEIGTHFKGNKNITEIIIGNEVQTIEKGAFSSCTGIKSVVIVQLKS